MSTFAYQKHNELVPSTIRRVRARKCACVRASVRVCVHTRVQMCVCVRMCECARVHTFHETSSRGVRRFFHASNASNLVFTNLIYVDFFADPRAMPRLTRPMSTACCVPCMCVCVCKYIFMYINIYIYVYIRIYIYVCI